MFSGYKSLWEIFNSFEKINLARESCLFLTDKVTQSIAKKSIEELLHEHNIDSKEFEWLKTFRTVFYLSQNIHFLEIIIIFIFYNFTFNNFFNLLFLPMRSPGAPVRLSPMGLALPPQPPP